MQSNVKNDTAAVIKRHRRAPKKSKHPKLRIVLIALLVIVVISTLAVFGYVYSVISKAPKIDPSKINTLLSESTTIYDDQGKELDTVFASSNRETVSIKRCLNI